MGWDAAVGASFLPDDVLAPVLALGSAYETDSWGAVFSVRTTMDSNFAIGGRAFETQVHTLALGPRLKVFARDRLWFGVDVVVLGTLSRYRRSDLHDASLREWVDLGFGVEPTGRVRLFGSLWLFVRGGVHLIPTAPDANIKNGPGRSTGYVRLPVLAGVELFL